VRLLALFTALLGALAGVGWLLACEVGAVIAAASRLLAFLSLYWYADKCVLCLARATQVRRDVAPDLFRMVERLAAQAGVPAATLRLYWLPGAAPNALAAGHDMAHAAIAITPDLPSFLDHDELAGLLVRELAYLRRGYPRLGDTAAAVAGGLMLLGCWPEGFTLAPEWGEQSSDLGGAQDFHLDWIFPAHGARARLEPLWRAPATLRSVCTRQTLPAPKCSVTRYPSHGHWRSCPWRTARDRYVRSTRVWRSSSPWPRTLSVLFVRSSAPRHRAAYGCNAWHIRHCSRRRIGDENPRLPYVEPASNPKGDQTCTLTLLNSS
jgi:hypothetical protein